ncbi:M23 family metallopeptidase [Brachybacterium hainanense]|uniref:M23 family metallopeptidase n=1 Tax=Brachybacterium hainanense TaxID=1541174 RepID=A0ABV6R8H9_9MICO
MIAAAALDYPFTGRWLVQNSPADQVPSHGTHRFASAHAIDFVPVDEDGRTAPIRGRTLIAPEPPQRFPGFGRPILAPGPGTVLAIRSDAPDHDAHRGLPSLGYAVTQGRRAAGGWSALAGNHVLLRIGPHVIALCHLQRGSIVVRPGDPVRSGDLLGRCGNSGNSTEPHLHVQAMDGEDPDHAGAVPLTFGVAVTRGSGGALPRSGEIVDVH